jgi:hypothetical protein
MTWPNGIWTGYLRINDALDMIQYIFDWRLLYTLCSSLYTLSIVLYR